MNNLIRKMLTLIVLIASTSCALAEIELTSALAKDIGRTYGFHMGQTYSLHGISKKFPSMSASALVAEREFSATFQSSIERMDALMAKHAESEWNKIKNQLTTQIPSSINIEQLSEGQAYEFIELVKQRAKGKIESPVIETLLLFKAGYHEHPAREFLDGFKNKYSSDGVGKAKGVAFSLQTPKTWIAKEGNRPNIVQKFVSENGHGFEILLILIQELPLQPEEVITEQDISEILNPTDLKDFLPDGSVYMNSGKMTLENLPGYWMTFKMKVSRVRSTVEMESIMYTVFYKNKMIQIQGQVMTSINDEPIDRGGLKKYEPLFDLMANSLVLTNIYSDR